MPAPRSAPHTVPSVRATFCPSVAASAPMNATRKIVHNQSRVRMAASSTSANRNSFMLTDASSVHR